MTDEQYRESKRLILTDERYTPAVKQWALGELRRIYVEANGKEPPND